MCEPAGRVARWCMDRGDALVASGFAAAAGGILAANASLRHPGAVPASVCTFLAFALVAWRRRFPVVVAVLAGGLLLVPELTGYSVAILTSAIGFVVFALLFLITYALGAECEWRRSLVGLVPLVVCVNFASSTRNPLIEMLTIGPWLAGLVVASQRHAAEQLELRASELDEERELFAAESVRYERARIARELHDVVAHCVSLMVVQASAGERLANQDPAAAAEAFASISEAAREADAEIDRLVELLETTPSAGPSAGLQIVEELVRRARASGLRVSCQFAGDSDDLSAANAEAAYRLVQEAVTNAMKHAPGAAIEISVRGQAETIELQVINMAAAGSRSGLEGSGGGHGLSGMRERVGRCEGTMEAGPTADGGWRVAAVLPRHPRRTVDAGRKAARWQ
jgi:signal transduction histidine kinase